MTTRLNAEPLESRDTPATLYSSSYAGLVRFDSSAPGSVSAIVPYQGLMPGESVRFLDFRPRTGQLYGLTTRSFGAHFSEQLTRLLVIDPATGQTRPIGDSRTSGTSTIAFDFDPTADRIRTVSGRGIISSGVNGRVHPDDRTGTADTPANGEVSVAAYDRNFDGKLGPNGTTLYTINGITGTLQTMGTVNQTVSANTGTLFDVGPLATPIDPFSVAGFDIAVDGTAYATFDGDTGPGYSLGLYSINLTTGAATRVGPVGNGTTSYSGLAVAPEERFAVGSGVGEESRVEVYDAAGNRVRVLNPFPSFFSGVTVATADVTRDGVPDVLVGAGPGGGPHVKVYDGKTWAEVYSFFAYDEPFRGGVNVAGGDVNGDGYSDILTGAGAGGGPHVKALSGKDLTELASYMAYDLAFTGGVRVAAGDFNIDGADEMVTAAGPGGGPHVKVFARDLLTGTTGLFGGGPASYFAYDPAFTGGVWVASGDVDLDGVAEIITGADAGGGPHVKALSGKDGTELTGFYAFDSGFTGGVRVGVADVNRDGRVEVLAAPGRGLTAVARGFDRSGMLVRSLDVLAGTDGMSVG